MNKFIAFIKKHGKMLLILAAVLIPVAVFCGTYVTGNAFGDYNDYDYDYDFGGDSGGGFDWDLGSSDSGSSDSGFIWFLFSFVYDLFGLPGVCCLVVVIIIIFTIVTISKNSKKNKRIDNSSDYRSNNYGNNMNQNRNMNNQYVKKTPKAPDAPKPDRTLEIAEIITAEDEFFTEPDFITYAKQVYMDIQQAWCNRDLHPVQAVIHTNLYERTKSQLDMKIRDRVVPHLERLTVEDAYMTGFRQDKEYEYVVVYLASKMIDYQTNEDTGEVIYGDRESRWEMHYLMTFMRSRNVKTPKMGAASRAFNCPNCGAAMGNSTTFGVCEFCGSSVKSGEYGWVLSDFSQAKDSTPDIGVTVDKKPEDMNKIQNVTNSIQGNTPNMTQDDNNER